jgi:hypothetical protein
MGKFENVFDNAGALSLAIGSAQYQRYPHLNIEY